MQVDLPSPFLNVWWIGRDLLVFWYIFSPCEMHQPRILDHGRLSWPEQSDLFDLPCHPSTSALPTYRIGENMPVEWIYPWSEWSGNNRAVMSTAAFGPNNRAFETSQCFMGQLYVRHA
jgi:hypothetical protein